MTETVKLNRQDMITALGWVLSLLVPLVMYYQLREHAVIWSINYFMTFFSAALVLWMFRLVHYLVPALLLIACCLLLNVVPENIILSGFNSKSFFLVLSFSFLGAIILKSNLLMRPTLWILSKLPPRLIWLEIFLYSTGLISSAFVNVQTNRFDITIPLYRILLGETNLRNNPFVRTCLSMACYAGTIYFSELFLTGKSTNLPVLEMLPAQTQLHFTWGYWLLAACVPVLFMQLPLIATFYFFHKKITFNINKVDLLQKRQALGKTSFAEIIALIGIGLLIIGIVLSSLNIVQLSWFCITLLFFLLLFPILSKHEFRSYINWAFLIYLGAIISVVQGMHYLHIDTDIINLFPTLLSWATKNIFIFLVIVFLICMISTILIGTVASIILLLPILMPLTTQLGISPWVLAFIISVACEAWFMPYQSTYHIYCEELTEGDGVFEQQKVLWMNIIFIAYRFIGLALGIFYWRYLGLV